MATFWEIIANPTYDKKVQVGKDQEKAQSERDSHSKNRGGKKPNQQSGTYTMKHIVSKLVLYVFVTDFQFLWEFLSDCTIS